METRWLNLNSLPTQSSVTNHKLRTTVRRPNIYISSPHTKPAWRNVTVHIHKELQNFRRSSGSRNLVCAWEWAQCVGLASASHTSHNEAQRTNIRKAKSSTSSFLSARQQPSAPPAMYRFHFVLLMWGTVISCSAQGSSPQTVSRHSLYQDVHVKQSLYRPGPALSVPGGWGYQISWKSSHVGGEFAGRLYS